MFLLAIIIVKSGWIYFIWCLSILKLDSFHQVVPFSEPLFKFLPKVGRKGASRCDVEEAVDDVEEKDQEAQETKKGVWVECISELKMSEI